MKTGLPNRRCDDDDDGGKDGDSNSGMIEMGTGRKKMRKDIFSFNKYINIQINYKRCEKSNFGMKKYFSGAEKRKLM